MFSLARFEESSHLVTACNSGDSMTSNSVDISVIHPCLYLSPEI